MPVADYRATSGPGVFVIEMMAPRCRGDAGRYRVDRSVDGSRCSTSAPSIVVSHENRGVVIVVRSFPVEQPNPVLRLTVVVEDILATAVLVDRSACAVGEVPVPDDARWRGL